MGSMRLSKTVCDGVALSQVWPGTEETCMYIYIYIYMCQTIRNTCKQKYTNKYIEQSYVNHSPTTTIATCMHTVFLNPLFVLLVLTN